MAVNRVRSSTNIQVPPLPELVSAEAHTTDAGLITSADAQGRILLRGRARGNDAAGTALSLSFDGARVEVSLREGMAPREVVRLIERGMPEGYRLSVSAPRGDAELCVEVVRRPRMNPPAQERTPERRADPAPASAPAVADSFAP